MGKTSDNAFLLSKEEAGPQYTDEGSRAAGDVSFYFHPTAKETTYNSYKLTQRLGQSPARGYGGASSVHAALFMEAGGAEPIGSGDAWWSVVWMDKGTGRPDDYSVWQVRSERVPQGYVCLSPCFFKVHKGGGGSGYLPPSEEDVRGMVAVKEALVTYVPGGSLVHVWDDRGSHAKQDVSIYTGPDSVGCFAFPTYSPPPSDGRFPLLDRSKGRLIVSHSALAKSIHDFTAGSIADGGHFMSVSRARVAAVWGGVDSDEPEDFAYKMRAAVAAHRNDLVSSSARAGCFCGVAFVTLNQPGDPSSVMNLVLLPDETMALFDPKKGEFVAKDAVKSFQAVVY